MNILKTFWRKPKKEEEKESIDLSKLENHYILHVGLQHCSLCNKETIHCYKTDIEGQCVCVCPRKDIKGFRKPKKEEDK